MAFKEVSSLDAEVTVALGKIDKSTGKPYPKQAEGYYLGMRTVKNKRGESKLHFLQTAKGNLGLWGTTDLDRKLGQVTPGAMVRVTSTGTKPTPNGDMYTYKVEMDADNAIEVSATETTSQDDSYDGDLSNDPYPRDASSGGDDDETEEADETPASVFSSADLSARKAKLEALIGKKKPVSK